MIYPLFLVSHLSILTYGYLLIKQELDSNKKCTECKLTKNNFAVIPVIVHSSITN